MAQAGGYPIRINTDDEEIIPSLSLRNAIKKVGWEEDGSKLVWTPVGFSFKIPNGANFFLEKILPIMLRIYIKTIKETTEEKYR